MSHTCPVCHKAANYPDDETLLDSGANHPFGEFSCVHSACRENCDHRFNFDRSDKCLICAEEASSDDLQAIEDEEEARLMDRFDMAAGVRHVAR